MVNKSLENLGVDYIDLYIYHMWDYRTPLYDVLEGLNNAVKKGKVRYIGISNCFAWQLAKANALAEWEGFAKFISVQGHYNLLFREEEREGGTLRRRQYRHDAVQSSGRRQTFQASRGDFQKTERRRLCEAQI